MSKVDELNKLAEKVTGENPQLEKVSEVLDFITEKTSGNAKKNTSIGSAIKHLADNYSAGGSKKIKLPRGTFFTTSTCTNFDWLKNFDTSEMTSGYGMFRNCKNITSIPEIDTSNMQSLYEMFYGCLALQTVPVMNWENVGNTDSLFASCPNLSDEGLNNIMASALTAKLLGGSQKTLKALALNSEQATRCQSLSNWNALVAAGWYSGY